MRLVDDFLLITPDLHEAQAFLKYDTHQIFRNISVHETLQALNNIYA